MGRFCYSILFGQVEIICYIRSKEGKFPYLCPLLKLNDQARCRKTVVLESKI